MTTRPRPPIFLSASVPFREPKKYRPDPVAIREAIRALVAIVVPDRILVFGGHPAITPLVWDAAHSLHAEDFVYIYQSELYRDSVPQEARYFPNLVWTPVRPGATAEKPRDRSNGLNTMREWMIVHRRTPPGRLPLDPYFAGVFIGGMDGVEEEWRMFVQTYPDASALPIASTEGAARRVWTNLGRPRSVSKTAWPQLESDLNYRPLFRALLT